MSPPAPPAAIQGNAATILKDLGEPYGTQLGKMFIENVKAAFAATAERSYSPTRGPPR